jgi:peptidyl-prolyl cis-trans isomerase B (cyclophilin B)
MRAEKQAIIEKQRKRRTTGRRVVTFGAIGAAIILIIVLIQVSGSGSKKTAGTTTSTRSTTTTAVPTSTFPTPSTIPLSTKAVVPTCPGANETERITWFTKAPPDCISKTSVWSGTFDTSVGDFTVKMPAASSYAGVNNFVFLARWNYYNGTFFHRIVTNFVIQGGDPTGTGSGGPDRLPGYSFTGNTPPSSCEAKKDCYTTGDIVYANSGAPSSDGSQFFVVLPGGASQLSPDYTLFGTVTSGLSVVEKIGTFGSSGETGTPTTKVYVLKITVKEINS